MATGITDYYDYVLIVLQWTLFIPMMVVALFIQSLGRFWKITVSNTFESKIFKGQVEENGGSVSS
jgi:hypothetical protein